MRVNAKDKTRTLYLVLLLLTLLHRTTRSFRVTRQQVHTPHTHVDTDDLLLMRHNAYNIRYTIVTIILSRTAESSEGRWKALRLPSEYFKFASEWRGSV